MAARVKLVNLEEGHPTVNQGLFRLEQALMSARTEAVDIVKFIHGYGSSGVGGRLRDEVWKVLDHHRRARSVRAFIPGEQFRISDETTWALLKKWPELKLDRDLGRKNRGITVVVL